MEPHEGLEEQTEVGGERAELDAGSVVDGRRRKTRQRNRLVTRYRIIYLQCSDGYGRRPVGGGKGRFLKNGEFPARTSTFEDEPDRRRGDRRVERRGSPNARFVSNRRHDTSVAAKFATDTQKLDSETVRSEFENEIENFTCPSGICILTKGYRSFDEKFEKRIMAEGDSIDVIRELY